jgi:hypothetical protein
MSAVYSKSPDVVFRKIADEFILVPIRQKVIDLKSVYTLNETAAFIWERIDGKRASPQIEEDVANEFETDLSTVKPDVEGIMSQLEALSLIKKA